MGTDRIIGHECGAAGRMRVPLFPLNTVLFPDGRIVLRVFEPRYMDMVKLCLHEEIGFGICMIKDGSSETAAGPSIADCGTYATIRDWDRMEDGVLGLHCYGEKRFRVHAEAPGPHGMRLADLDWFPEQPCREQPRLLQSCVEYLLSHGKDGMSERKYVEDPHWVGYRLAEILPLTTRSRQTLLEMEDAVLRLKALYAVIQTLGKKTLSS